MTRTLTRRDIDKLLEVFALVASSLDDEEVAADLERMRRKAVREIPKKGKKMADGLSKERLAEIREHFNSGMYFEGRATNAVRDLLAELARQTHKAEAWETASHLNESGAIRERVRAEHAERQIDAVWSALGITTVPVGMDVGAEVRKLKAGAEAMADELKAADTLPCTERIASLEAALRWSVDELEVFGVGPGGARMDGGKFSRTLAATRALLPTPP